MSLAALNAVAAGSDVATRDREFVAMAKLLVQTRFNLLDAAQRAPSPRIATILRSAVTGGGIATVGALAEYQNLVSAFLGSLAQTCAFDTMWPAMRRVPLRTRTGVVTIAATAGVSGEFEQKLVSRLTLVGGVLDAVKAVGIIVLSGELAEAGGPDAAALFARELKTAVSAMTDTTFISLIAAGISATPSAGSTAANAWTDIKVAFGAVATDESSRLYILVEPSTAKAWATLSSAGVRSFLEMTPQGGKVAGVPVLVSAGLAAGTIVVVDANAVAAASETLLLDSARHASVQLSNSPDSPPTTATVLTSLWQQNAVALRAERYFGAELLRSNGCAVISNVSY
jgi:hypothetical protein